MFKILGNRGQAEAALLFIAGTVAVWYLIIHYYFKVDLDKGIIPEMFSQNESVKSTQTASLNCEGIYKCHH